MNFKKTIPIILIMIVTMFTLPGARVFGLELSEGQQAMEYLGFSLFSRPQRDDLDTEQKARDWIDSLIADTQEEYPNVAIELKIFSYTPFADGTAEDPAGTDGRLEFGIEAMGHAGLPGAYGTTIPFFAIHYYQTEIDEAAAALQAEPIYLDYIDTNINSYTTQMMIDAAKEALDEIATVPMTIAVDPIFPVQTLLWNTEPVAGTVQSPAGTDGLTNYIYNLVIDCYGKKIPLELEFAVDAPTAYAPAPVIGIDYEIELLTGFTEGDYTWTSNEIGESFTYGGGGNLPIDAVGGFGRTITFIKKGDGATIADSEPCTIEIPSRPQKPPVYSVTLAGDDGRITGLDKNKTYEYKVKIAHNDTIETVTGVREIIGLAPTDYQVRYPAAEDRFASEWKDVRVFDYDAPKIPVLTSLTISEGTLTPAFDSGIIEYTATVPYSVSSVTISAAANFMKTGTGVKSLSVGENTFAIEAYNSSIGTTRIYYITITKQAYVPPVQSEPEPEPEPEKTKPKSPSYNSPAPLPAPAPTYTPGEKEEFTTKSGVTSTVTVTEDGVIVEAGLNKSGSVNSEATAAAVKKAAEIAKANGETSITIAIPNGATGLSAATVQKLVKAANGTKIELALTSMTDGEEVGSISLPINAKTGQILTGITFNTNRTESVENYITNKWDTDVLGSFETAQKGGWGGTATLSIGLDKLGFSADDGTKLYALIYDTKAKKWYQVSAIIEDGNVIIETKRTGIITIVTDSVK